MPTLEPIDEAFFETAPVRFARSWEAPMPAAELWQELTDRPLHWCRGLSIRWTSPQPFGVGTTRHVAVLGALQADEHFFLWEEGRRSAFFFTRANLPVFEQFGEYYEVEPAGETTCRFTWKLAARPTTIGRPGNLANALLVRGLFRDTTRYFDRRRATPAR